MVVLFLFVVSKDENLWFIYCFDVILCILHIEFDLVILNTTRAPDPSEPPEPTLALVVGAHITLALVISAVFTVLYLSFISFLLAMVLSVFWFYYYVCFFDIIEFFSQLYISLIPCLTGFFGFFGWLTIIWNCLFHCYFYFFVNVFDICTAYRNLYIMHSYLDWIISHYPTLHNL